MKSRSGFNSRRAGVPMGVVLLVVIFLPSGTLGILDFLDPFLSKTEPQNGGGEIGGSGSLSGSGHVGAGLGDLGGFSADGSIAASKGLGVNFGNENGVPFDRQNPQFQGEFQDQRKHELIPVPQGKFLPPPPPPPPRHQQPIYLNPNKPCDKNGRPIEQHPPPPNQRDGPFFKNRQFRGVPDRRDDSPSSTGPVKDSDVEGVDVDKDGDIDDDDEDFLRQARALLDKAIFQKKGNNSSNSAKNSTLTSSQKDLGKDRVARSHLADDKTAKNATSSPEDQGKNGTQRVARHHPVDDDNFLAKNASDLAKNATVKRSVPVLVVEHVQFIPLDKHFNSTNGPSSSPDDDLNDNQPRSENSSPPQVKIPQNTTQEEKNSTKNATSGGDRVISPKFAHMFHNMFAG